MKSTRMGRPKAINPKIVKYSIRLDSYTEKRLIYYCNKNHITKGEAIRKGINLLLVSEK